MLQLGTILVSVVLSSISGHVDDHGLFYHPTSGGHLWSVLPLEVVPGVHVLYLCRGPCWYLMSMVLLWSGAMLMSVVFVSIEGQVDGLGLCYYHVDICSLCCLQVHDSIHSPCCV